MYLKKNYLCFLSTVDTPITNQDYRCVDRNQVVEVAAIKAVLLLTPFPRQRICPIATRDR